MHLQGTSVCATHSTSTPPIPNPKLFKMSNDDKARAAAAQLMIDDEPDDWWVAIPVLRAAKLMTIRRDKRIFSTGCAGMLSGVELKRKLN